ncbi:MAG: TonB-dependent receptor [Gemmatimonadetes bacterium]|nr:TonB-dependent receptor [Gemmatimonadota bacterium]
MVYQQVHHWRRFRDGRAGRVQPQERQRVVWRPDRPGPGEPPGAHGRAIHRGLPRQHPPHAWRAEAVGGQPLLRPSSGIDSKHQHSQLGRRVRHEREQLGQFRRDEHRWGPIHRTEAVWVPESAADRLPQPDVHPDGRARRQELCVRRRGSGLRAPEGGRDLDPLGRTVARQVDEVLQLAITGATLNGANPGNPGNADLKPERGTEYEAGLDASFWKDRVSAELTYYNKQTKDLIIAKPIAPSLGFNSNPLRNIGSVVNSGVELGLTVAAVQMNNFEWDIRAGINTLHNELTSLGGVAAFAPGGSFSHTRAMLGQQLGVYVSKRIKSIDEATGLVVVADTVSPVGNLYPTLEWNVSNSFTIMRDFRVTALVDSKRDFITDNFTDFYRETQLVRGQNRLDPNKLSRRERLRRYGNDTPGKPAFVTVTGSVATQNDAYEAWEQPGDFVRFRELSISYNVPKRFLSSLRNTVQSASIQFAMQNLKLWTQYEGPDPEVVTDSGNFSRADFFTLPTPKRSLLRVNITF